MSSAERTVTIVNQRGLHARASAKFVNIVSELPDNIDVRVSKDGLSAGGGSILGLMMLGAAKGHEIVIKVEGPGAEHVADQLQTLVANGFDED